MPQEFTRLARLFIALAGFTVLAACGGGGGGSLGDDNGTPPPGGGNPPPGGGGPNVTISGRITFDRIQFNPTLNTGLAASAPVESPAREVVVQAVSGSNVLTSTITDANGAYSLSVPSNTTLFIRARARMEKTGAAPTWRFAVLNNTNSDAEYVLDGASASSGTADSTRDLRATSGWGGSSYTGTRAAAPFAILDTVYRAKEMIRVASPNAVFPELNLYWSVNNRTAASPFCPNTGDIGTSFYFRDPTNSSTDDCAAPSVLPNGIYILGDFAGGNGDTDEFDSHVIAHEFGHYFEDRFSRSDSIGGEHGGGDRLDLRVAFGEGWGNAFGAMSLVNPQYRDSFSGIDQDFGFNLETGSGNDGWFSEASVGEILWDVFDDATAFPESGDNVGLGFGAIFNVMNDAQVDTPALTSIFSFATALRAANGGSSSAIGNLLDNENINGTGEFGASESNAGGDVGFNNVYTDIAVGAPSGALCSTSSASGNTDGNKLGNRRFLRFVKNTSGPVTIQANGVAAGGVAGSGAAQDPDILVHRAGQILSFGTLPNGEPIGQSSVAGSETMSQVQLAAGTYVLEVYAFEVIDPNTSVTTPRCMSISISGTN